MNKPKTKREIALWRCKTTTEIARDALDGKLEHTQEQHEQIRYALYNIASAIGDLAEAFGVDEKKEVSMNSEDKFWFAVFTIAIFTMIGSIVATAIVSLCIG